MAFFSASNLSLRAFYPSGSLTMRRTDRPNIHDGADDDDDAAPSPSAAHHFWDDALLYRVAVDPFEPIATSGRDEGRAAGLRDGYLGGFDVGTSKGWEIGLELGYYRGFARGVSDGMIRERRSLSPPSSSSRRTTTTTRRTASRSGRCRTLAGDVSRMIDEFPDPDSLLSPDDDRRGAGGGAGRGRGTAAAATASGGVLSARDGDASIDSSDRDEAAAPTSGIDPSAPTATAAVAGMLDVSSSLERIRSKFRLLCILLRTERSFDLRRVLESGNGSGGGSDGGLDRRRGMNSADAASTSLDDTVESAGHGKSISQSTPGSAANGESSKTRESDW